MAEIKSELSVSGTILKNKFVAVKTKDNHLILHTDDFDVNPMKLSEFIADLKAIEINGKPIGLDITASLPPEMKNMLGGISVDLRHLKLLASGLEQGNTMTIEFALWLQITDGYNSPKFPIAFNTANIKLWNTEKPDLLKGMEIIRVD